jgi:hypothetical protein
LGGALVSKDHGDLLISVHHNTLMKTAAMHTRATVPTTHFTVCRNFSRFEAGNTSWVLAQNGQMELLGTGVQGFEAPKGGPITTRGTISFWQWRHFTRDSPVSAAGIGWLVCGSKGITWRARGPL